MKMMSNKCTVCSRTDTQFDESGLWLCNVHLMYDIESIMCYIIEHNTDMSLNDEDLDE